MEQGIEEILGTGTETGVAKSEASKQKTDNQRVEPGKSLINKYTRRELPELRKQIKRKFLVFRPYEDPMSIRPYQAPDRGYYFYLHKNDIKRAKRKL